MWRYRYTDELYHKNGYKYIDKIRTSKGWRYIYDLGKKAIVGATKKEINNAYDNYKRSTNKEKYYDKQYNKNASRVFELSEKKDTSSRAKINTAYISAMKNYDKRDAASIQKRNAKRDLDNLKYKREKSLVGIAENTGKAASKAYKKGKEKVTSFLKGLSDSKTKFEDSNSTLDKRKVFKPERERKKFTEKGKKETVVNSARRAGARATIAAEQFGDKLSISDINKRASKNINSITDDEFKQLMNYINKYNTKEINLNTGKVSNPYKDKREKEIVNSYKKKKRKG